MSVIELPSLTIRASGTIPDYQYKKIKETILGNRYELSIVFVGPTEAQRLNKTYRNKRYIPNTLSFPLDASAGELIICRSVARAQYKKFGMTYHTYVLFLLIHSMLHLKGMAHGSTMEKLEQEYVKKFS